MQLYHACDNNFKGFLVASDTSELRMSWCCAWDVLWLQWGLNFPRRKGYIRGGLQEPGSAVSLGFID